MREPRAVVINTGPTIALVAALGNLRVLSSLYARVVVPFEVCEELLADSSTRFAADEFAAATWLEKRDRPTPIPLSLLKTIGYGEASVIQCALDGAIATVVIDEAAGRRIARLHGLAVTGSLGILLRAKREGLLTSVTKAVSAMQTKGIWLSDSLVSRVLTEAGE